MLKLVDDARYQEKRGWVERETTRMQGGSLFTSSWQISYPTTPSSSIIIFRYIFRNWCVKGTHGLLPSEPLRQDSMLQCRVWRKRMHWQQLCWLSHVHWIFNPRYVETRWWVELRWGVVRYTKGESPYVLWLYQKPTYSWTTQHREYGDYTCLVTPATPITGLIGVITKPISTPIVSLIGVIIATTHRAKMVVGGFIRDPCDISMRFIWKHFRNPSRDIRQTVVGRLILIEEVILECSVLGWE